MRMYDLILKKRNGGKLTKEEIDFFVNGVTDKTIEPYHTSALMMATYFQGMDEEETLNLTLAMASSGEQMDLSVIDGVKVDKHSTGGVGDKTSLAVVPIVAACGVKVAKMSGRGLGHTGGTIDKLESIKGFQTSVEPEKFFDIVNTHGLCIAGQSMNLAPADKELYALRDVTATVDDISLIASSIMSKKLASGSDCILLDVKVGSGAFMKNYEDAENLAREMVKIGNGAGRKTVAVITDMDVPLGNAIGNSIEVIEAVETLKGNGPEDFTLLTKILSAEILKMAGIENAEEKVEEAISSGKALEKLASMVSAQGGDENYIYDTSLFEKAKFTREIKAECDGFISHMNAETVGVACAKLGAGREKKGDDIDFTAGIMLSKKTGDKVSSGEVIARIYASDESRFSSAEETFLSAVEYSEEEPEKRSLIMGKII
ncbi:MAG: thymidine phosphorylase [Ruminococcaceae bacterium]|nr:thymidine phosphorylase [Oscillospiraceae bacterium]